MSFKIYIISRVSKCRKKELKKIIFPKKGKNVGSLSNFRKKGGKNKVSGKKDTFLPSFLKKKIMKNVKLQRIE